MDNIYKNVEEYNLNKKRKLSIVFDDMITDTLSNKKLNPIVTELFIGNWIIYYTILFSYFAVLKNIRLNSTHYFILKIPNKQEV